MILTCNAFAQTADTTQQNLLLVEVRSIRAGTNAPFTKTELSQKDIEKQNLGQDIPYLLQYTPSVVSFSDAGAGVGYTGLRVRGTDGTRINVTLNGIPVNDAESQGTFFVNFPDLSSSTNSIQLQRGAGTSTNGAGAFGATMSISNTLQMDTAGAEINTSFGSFNTWKNTVKLGSGLLKNGLQFDLRLSRISSDGFRDRSASDLKALQLLTGWKVSDRTSLRFMLMTGNEKTQQAWNGVHEAQLTGNTPDLMRHYQHNQYAVYFTPQDSVNLFSSDPRKYNYFTYKNQTDNYRQDYYQLFLDHHFNPYLSLNIAAFMTRGKGYYEEYKPYEDYEDYGLQNVVHGEDTVTTSDIIRQLWLDNYFYGGTFSLQYAKKNTQLTLGGALTQYNGKHYGFVKWAQQGGVPNDYEWYHLPVQKNDFNIYAKAQHTLQENLILFGDLQLRSLSYNIHGFRKNPGIDVNANYTFFNPKAGITYLLTHTATEKQKLYASVAFANKEPNRDDFEASPDKLPEPETLTDVEAGYEWNTQKWSASVNAYYMRYKNQLILTGKINDVGAYTRTNVPESYRAGIELQAGIAPFSWLRFNANATFSRNKIINFNEYVDNWDSGMQDSIHRGTTDIAFSPNVIAAGTLTIIPFSQHAKAKSLEIDLLGKYVGKQYLDNTGKENRAMASYFVNDIRLRYTAAFRPFKELNFMLGLNNVLNKKYSANGYTYAYTYEGTAYTDNYYFPQAGFNWMLGVNMKF
ncbi:MAG TPA: TonB-dependent receptor [Flavipsychrobacter sp.]|nr:TonB-dependent receptor [Flavipsychrobacter sp.]